MSFYDEHDRSHSAREIELSPENHALLESFVNGVSCALSCEAVHTFEMTDEATEYIPTPESCLARAVIYQLGATATAGPDFQVALTMKANQLTADSVQDLTTSDSGKLGFAQGDSIRIELLDSRSRGVYNWFSTYHSDSKMFEFAGGRVCDSILHAPIRPESPVIEATGSCVHYDPDGKLPFGVDSLSPIDTLRTIGLALDQGNVDLASTDRLVKILGSRNNTKLLTMDPSTMINAGPHFRNILGGALSTPSVRDMFARLEH